MTLKITALLTSVCVAVLYLFSLKYPNDPYFYIISSKAVVGAARVLIATIMIFMAMQGRFRYRVSRRLSTISALFLILLGLTGLIAAPFNYALFDYLKPLDYIFAIEAGLFFTLITVSFKRGTKRIPQPGQLKLNQSRLFTKRTA